MTPETIIDFIKNKQIWESEATKEALLQEYKRCLTLLNNKTKNIDFLQTNRLIYAFQKNIVANGKKEGSKYHKYLNWFELAEKTKNKLNKKSDFLKYAEDEIFAELIRRLCKEVLTTDDYEYIKNYREMTEQVKRWEKPIYQEGMEMGIGIGVEKGIGIGVEQKAKETAIKLIKKGMSNEEIAEITDLPVLEIEKIRNELKNSTKN